MAEDQEWQPIKMVSTEEMLKSHDMGEVYLPHVRANAGKIVRVRPCKEIPPCSAKQGYEVHPDDRHILAECAQFVCEHQILAD